MREGGIFFSFYSSCLEVINCFLLCNYCCWDNFFPFVLYRQGINRFDHYHRNNDDNDNNNEDMINR